MSNIGFSSPDWGMAGYYAQEDAAQKWEEYQEYLYDREQKNYESNKERVLQFAAETAKAYQDESDGEEYSTETWREWLAEESAWIDDDLNKAVMFAIREEEDFTFAEAIDGLAYKHIEKSQVIAA